MQFQKKCLFCGQPNNSINYSCSCSEAGWHDEYRTLDLDLLIEEYEYEEIRRSVEEYDFDDNKGMMQYRALPHRDYLPESVELIGLTPLLFLSEYSSDIGCRVYIKNEGDNPSGCFKDRETLMCLLNTRRRHLNHATIYSSGNAAASAALIAQEQGLKLITLVAGDTYEEKIDFIRDHGTAVIVVGDEETSFEEGFRMYARLNSEGVFARSGYDNWSVRNPYRAQGDKTTAIEIFRQLSAQGQQSQVPDYILVPSANGTHLVGIWKGFRELKMLGLIDSLPKMIPVGIAGAHPIHKAIAMKLTDRPARSDLTGLDEKEMHIGSTIIAEEGYDSIEASKAVLESGGFALGVKAMDIQKAMVRFLSLEKDLATSRTILPEPTSYIALAAIEQLMKKEQLKPETTIVSMITGHGMKALDLTLELLEGHSGLQKTVNRIATDKAKDISKEAPVKGPRVNVEAGFEKVSSAFAQMKEKIQ